MVVLMAVIQFPYALVQPADRAELQFHVLRGRCSYVIRINWSQYFGQAIRKIIVCKFPFLAWVGAFCTLTGTPNFAEKVDDNILFLTW